MPHTIRRTPDAACVLTPLDEIAGNIRHCIDLSALMLFIADMVGHEEGAALLVSDPAVCARGWRGVAAVQQQLQEGLALVQAAAEELHERTTPSTSGAP
jgi:hypothetical protein